MFTAKIGKTNINTIDENHIPEQIRSWSKKKIIKCPACNGNLVYKNGLIRLPHFAHEKSECLIKYHENETEEHMLGKIVLYKWLLKQSDLENVILEHWIPETKQRPDLYFEVNGIRCVIEFQCTPITVKEYRERHELYRLNNIIDIWIFGVDKYDMSNYLKNEGKILNYRTKALEREVGSFKNIYYLDSKNKDIYYNIKSSNSYGQNGYLYKYSKRNIFDCLFNDLRELFKTQSEIYNKNKFNKTIKKRKEFDPLFKEMIISLREKYKDYKIETRGLYNEGRYLYKIIFNIKDRVTHAFFIKDLKIDFCEMYSYSRRCGRGFSKNYGYRTLDSLQYESLSVDVISGFINKILN